MTKKDWVLDHQPQPPAEPPQTTLNSFDGSDKIKDSVLLSTRSAPFPADLDIESEEVKTKYPKSVFFIVSNEFCERFTYYGLRTILSLYLASSLSYTEDSATVMYHAFAMLCYFFPLIGAIIADTWLGKFRTILYLSIVYCGGSILISLSSGYFDNNKKAEEAVSLTGLFLIAVGTGGIKPCVSAFGGDQFKLPEQRLKLAQFFSVFYFSINAGSLISTFITPIFRQDVKCLGQDTCYPLAFGVPAIVMVVSLVIFIVGRPMYKINPPQGNALLRVLGCIRSAITGKRKRGSTTQERWIDYADQDKYDKTLRDDVMITLKVLVLFLPLPIFWALFDQQGSRWTFQAVNMNGRIGSWVIKPDQMQVVNPVLILAFLPMMEGIVYPLLARIHLLRKPLQRMATGGVLASVSFIISAFLEWQLEKTYPVALTPATAQLRMFNFAPCPVNISSASFNTFELNEDLMHAELALKAIKESEIKLKAEGKCVPAVEYTAKIKEKTGQSVYLFSEPNKGVWQQASTPDTVVKGSDVNPVVRYIFSFKDAKPREIRLQSSSSRVEASFKTQTQYGSSSEFSGIPVDSYSLQIDGTTVSSVFLDVAGTYSLLVTETSVTDITIRNPNSVHILWQVPQYVVITLAEVMFSVTGLEFAFTQAPLSMKSVLTSAWLLTVAVGNLIVLLIAEAELFKSHVYEFLLFASLMAVVILIFIFIAVRYKYREDIEEATDNATQETTPSTQGNQKS